MTSSRPYLIRALYEWITDNDMTPHLLVDAQQEGVVVPPSVIRDGKVTFNISMTAVRDLQLENDMISFSARFGGVAQAIFVPPSAVLGVYARENGQGIMFPDEVADEDDQGPEPDDTPPAGRPQLKVVK